MSMAWRQCLPRCTRTSPRCLVVSVQDFAKSCLMFENPSAYEALFGSLPEDLRAAA